MFFLEIAACGADLSYIHKMSVFICGSDYLKCHKYSNIRIQRTFICFSLDINVHQYNIRMHNTMWNNDIAIMWLYIWELKDLSEFLQHAHLKQLLCDICDDINQHIIRKLIQLFGCHITKYTIIMTYIMFKYVTASTIKYNPIYTTSY